MPWRHSSCGLGALTDIISIVTMTLSKTTLSITVNKMRHSAQWQSVVTLNVANGPFTFSVITLSVIMLSAVAPPFL